MAFEIIYAQYCKTSRKFTAKAIAIYCKSNRCMTGLAHTGNETLTYPASWRVGATVGIDRASPDFDTIQFL
jgi:hypothetical protein